MNLQQLLSPEDVSDPNAGIPNLDQLRALKRLLGIGGEERFLTWPEKMVRSAFTAPGDALAGRLPIESHAAFPGAAEPYSGDRIHEGGRPIPGPESAIARVQDLSNLAMSGAIPAAASGVIPKAALGSGGSKLPPGWAIIDGVPKVKTPEAYYGETALFTEKGKTLTPKQLEQPGPGVQFEIPDPTKLRIKEAPTIGPGGKLDKANPLFLVEQPSLNPDYKNLPHIHDVVTGFTTREQAEGFIKATQGQKRPDDYTGLKLRSGLGDEGSLPATAPVGQLAQKRWAPEGAGHVVRETPEGFFAGYTKGEGGIGPFKTRAEVENFIQNETAGFAPQPVFYSAVENAVRMFDQDKGSPEQWLGTLRNHPGVKQEEIAWLGLEDWLKTQKHPVSKKEVQDYIDSHKVEVKDALNTNRSTNEELVMDTAGELGDRWVTRAIEPTVVQQGGHYLLKMGNDVVETYGSKTAAEHARGDLAEGLAIARERGNDWAETSVEDFAWEAAGVLASRKGSDSGRYAEYQLPGGENYQELLLTLPTRGSGKPPNKGDSGWGPPSETTQFGKDNYQSSHWDEPNVLAHVRFNDRMIDGKKTLFLEEIQSDWHQQGRKQGYKSDKTGEMKDWKAKKIGDEEWQVFDKNGNMVAGEDVFAPTEKDAIKMVYDATEGNNPMAVPDAPFKKSWPELAMKRMIRYAAENGYDKIAWTPGEVQNARWRGAGDNSKFYDEILVNTANKLGKAFGAKVDKREFTYRDLPPDAWMSGEKAWELLGREGQKTFGVPTSREAFSKWFKEASQKDRDRLIAAGREKQKIDNSAKAHTMDLTDQMRSTALGKGFPLFQGGFMLIPVDGNPFEEKQ